MSGFQDHIRAMTAPRNGTYPRPWMTDTDPEQADVLIVGASSAKTFYVADVGNHEQFLDALWNRNGRTCRTMYRVATTKPSPTRPNLDRLSTILAERGLSSLQTNVTCASAPYDAEIPQEDRAHGTELFKAVLAHCALESDDRLRCRRIRAVWSCIRRESPAGAVAGFPPPVSTAFQGRPVVRTRGRGHS